MRHNDGDIRLFVILAMQLLHELVDNLCPSVSDRLYMEIESFSSAVVNTKWVASHSTNFSRRSNLYMKALFLHEQRLPQESQVVYDA